MLCIPKGRNYLFCEICRVGKWGVSHSLLYHNHRILQPKNAAKNAIHRPRMAHNVQRMRQRGESTPPVTPLLYFRRFPGGSIESSNPLSSAFASSNSLSSPLFFSCVYPQLVSQSPLTWVGTCTHARYSSKMGWHSFVRASPFKNLPVSWNSRVEGSGGRTCLCTSSWSMNRTVFWALCIPLRSLRPWRRPSSFDVMKEVGELEVA
jgi:hypothetical protein